MHVQVVTCTVQFILSFSNISPSYELVHVGYLYDCWLASAMCPATAGAAGWLPGIRNSCTAVRLYYGTGWYLVAGCTGIAVPYYGTGSCVSYVQL
jgi:hypothetical protein